MGDQNDNAIEASLAIADTSIASDNLGDQIIMEAVERELSEILEHHPCFRLSTHSPLGHRGRRILGSVDMAFVGGTNLLPARPGPRQLWRVTPQPESHRRFVLVGCGFNDAPTKSSGRFLRSVLHPTALHSCRDERTAEFLNGIGLNASLTGCVTTWSVRDDVASRPIPSQRQDTAVLILNHSLGRSAADRLILTGVRDTYDRVVFWPQAPRDLTYAAQLGFSRDELVTGGLPGLKRVLESLSIDVVTTRLHAALLASRLGARTHLFTLADRVSVTVAPVGITPISAPSNSLEVIAGLHTDPMTFSPRSSDVAVWRRGINQRLGGR